jgi:hypothetical protein
MPSGYCLSRNFLAYFNLRFSPPARLSGIAQDLTLPSVAKPAQHWSRRSVPVEQQIFGDIYRFCGWMDERSRATVRLIDRCSPALVSATRVIRPYVRNTVLEGPWPLDTVCQKGG